MAIEELEAVAFRPGDIAGHRFAMEQRGYEPEEVHRFLHLIAEYVGRLQGQVEWQRTRVEYLEQRGVSAQDSAYERLSREFMEVVRRADEAAAEVRMKAEGEARAVLDKAGEKAGQMIASSAEEAERLLLTAREEAERLVGDATRRVERLVHQAGTGGSPQPGNGYVTPEPTNGYVAARSINGNVAPGPVGRPEHGDAAGLLQGIAGPALADFEALNLEFEGSLFDLFGDGD
jgi:DivIVA domain-containing protein